MKKNEAKNKTSKKNQVRLESKIRINFILNLFKVAIR